MSRGQYYDHSFGQQFRLRWAILMGKNFVNTATIICALKLLYFESNLLKCLQFILPKYLHNHKVDHIFVDMGGTCQRTVVSGLGITEALGIYMYKSDEISELNE
jgi:hypothetical protein